MLKLLLVLILLVASAFRMIGIDNFPTPQGATPPGLEHDEVAHWLINRDILAGHHAIYFTEAYGHEALYHYLQAYFGALAGDHALALRLPSAYFGILLVAVSFALGRRLFGIPAGLWSAAFLAVLFWPVFYSRLALRAISLPVLSGLAACWWWRAFEHKREDIQPDSRFQSLAFVGDDLAFLIAGLLAGLSLHTYMAARAVPIFFAGFTLYLILFHRPVLRSRRTGVGLFWFSFALVVAPLTLYLINNPGAEVRIAEVDAPLRAFLGGEFGPVLTNAVKIAGMFGVRGDPLWRQNIAGRPVFDAVLAALFYAGVILSIWRWRQARYAFLLLWLGASAIPSLVTIDAPSSIRLINLLPVLMLFPILATESLRGRLAGRVKGHLIHNNPNLSTIREKLSTNLITSLFNGGLFLLLIYHAWSTYAGLWRVWPANEEVRFVWQAALTEAASYLDTSAASGPVAVGGWTPDTMDSPTMDLTLRRDDLSLRYFDPAQSLILPRSGDGQDVRVVRPTILELAEPLQRIIGQWESARDEFTLYAIPAGIEFPPPETILDVKFGEQLVFLGFETEGCGDREPCVLATYWRVIAAPDGPRRIFAHAVDPTGGIVYQDDRLGAPAEFWQAGDTVIQLLTLPKLSDELRLGIYDPVSRRRLLTGDGGEYVVLPGLNGP